MDQCHLRRSRALPTHLRGFWVDGISSSQEPCELLRLAAVSRLDHTYSCISAKARRPNGLARRHLKNAAVLPNIRTAASVSSADVYPSSLCQQEEPVSIHGYSVQAYQGIYSSVVEPMMKTRSGRHRPYSLELGLKIKQRLWETLNCPELVETELMTESFSTTNRRSFAPRVHVDISKEPLPEEPQRKKTRQ
ncbi:putative protein si:rp71-45g20.11 isoform X1 [Labeo rohita]|uniref:Uncharacterized protein n=1 Tax=Labeo rohita TaxID=84645 RepID=A0A498NQQ7_LABRO|nr:putative protein si:rp71-45g20.11 isoform X1 [Labeo rohita]RXN34088.1 putative protein si:rp71-45g20.11 isoform X1 [Labeo rohita]